MYSITISSDNGTDNFKSEVYEVPTKDLQKQVYLLTVHNKFLWFKRTNLVMVEIDKKKKAAYAESITT